MMKKRLRDLEFVDLYIGADYVEVTGVRGLPNPAPIPPGYDEEVALLKAKAQEAYEKDREEGYALRIDDQLYRVTYLKEVDDHETYIFRKSQILIRPISDLGFQSEVVEELLSPKNTGLVLIVGAMAAGKTSTLASIGKARGALLGGIGVAIENPPETPLRGRHGKGRFLQVWARRRDGGYKAAIKKALRTGANMLLLGEILDSDAAYEGALASVAGHFVAATMHADSVVEAVQKMESWCGGRAGPRPGELLANALSMVIWQEREEVAGGVRLRNEVLFVRDHPEVKSKIRTTEGIAELRQDVHAQAAQLAWMRDSGGEKR